MGGRLDANEVCVKGVFNFVIASHLYRARARNLPVAKAAAPRRMMRLVQATWSAV